MFLLTPLQPDRNDDTRTRSDGKQKEKCDKFLADVEIRRRKMKLYQTSGWTALMIVGRMHEINHFLNDEAGDAIVPTTWIECLMDK